MVGLAHPRLRRAWLEHRERVGPLWRWWACSPLVLGAVGGARWVPVLVMGTPRFAGHPPLRSRAKKRSRWSHRHRTRCEASGPLFSLSDDRAMRSSVRFPGWPASTPDSPARRRAALKGWSAWPWMRSSHVTFLPKLITGGSTGPHGGYAGRSVRARSAIGAPSGTRVQMASRPGPTTAASHRCNLQDQEIPASWVRTPDSFSVDGDGHRLVEEIINNNCGSAVTSQG